MKTDLELKIALAEELPEMIEIFEYINPPERTKFYWIGQATGQTQIGTFDEVREREWEWILHNRISSLSTQLQREYFETHLYNLLASTVGFRDRFQAMFETTWQQRAKAYLKAKSE